MVTKKYPNDLGYTIIGCAIEVHKYLGPGLLESAYQRCLKREFDLRGIQAQSQLIVPIQYKGIDLDTDYRLDFLVEGELVLELKAIESILPVHEAQLLTYMKLLQKPKGILLNFNTDILAKGGIKQMVNQLFASLHE